MSEYIERGALLVHIAGVKICLQGKGEWISGYHDALQAVGETVQEFPAADVVEVDELKEFAADVVCQFGYYINGDDGRLYLSSGGLSTLEWAFSILGWDDPKPFPEGECECTGCHEYASCGMKTPDGYRRVCGKHARIIAASRESEKMNGGADK